MRTGGGGATTTGAGATTTGAGTPTLILTSAAEADESNPPAVITPPRNRAVTAIRPVVRMTPSMPDDHYLVVLPTNLTWSRPFNTPGVISHVPRQPAPTTLPAVDGEPIAVNVPATPLRMTPANAPARDSFAEHSPRQLLERVDGSAV